MAPQKPHAPVLIGLLRAIDEDDLRSIQGMLDADPTLARRAIVRDDHLIHRAALQGKQALVELVLVAGEEVAARGQLGRTPLHYAAEQGYVDLAKWLVVRGADTEARDERGWTPLDSAINSREPGGADVVAFLRKKSRGAKVGLRQAVQLDDIARVREILADDPEAVRQDPESWVLLEDQIVKMKMAALKARRSRAESIGEALARTRSLFDLLLEAGAAVNRPKGSGWGPLHEAVQMPAAEPVRVLFERGADPFESKPGVGSPLDTAKEMPYDETPAVMALLTEWMSRVRPK